MSNPYNGKVDVRISNRRIFFPRGWYKEAATRNPDSDPRLILLDDKVEKRYATLYDEITFQSLPSQLDREIKLYKLDLSRGRFTLPSNVMERLKITDNAVLFGVFDCIEIWNSECLKKENYSMSRLFIPPISKLVQFQ